MDQGAVREAGMCLNHHSQKRKWSHSLSSPLSLLNRPVCYCTSEMVLSFCSYIPLTPVLPRAGKSNWEMMANFQLLKITVWMNEQGAMLNFPRGKFQGWWERTVQQLWPPPMDPPFLICRCLWRGERKPLPWVWGWLRHPGELLPP